VYQNLVPPGEHQTSWQMDVHPTKNGINRYWSIPISKYFKPTTSLGKLHIFFTPDLGRISRSERWPKTTSTVLEPNGHSITSTCDEQRGRLCQKSSSKCWWFMGFTRPGKPTKNYGKSPFLMGKSTISMAMFNSYVTNYQRVYCSWWFLYVGFMFFFFNGI